ncbi:helix-turn-helix transcriptional regulator [Streptomyces sp. MZ04]|uniref:helix-turn-helix transcriptional regulator n=1 Tax=Streptomyces sp. MZ04 TaxID=2559236 RepID=UPI00107EDC7F|nr:helix-turn-helix transcriptional regulator [Streptomyces sp. MZ04]TGB08869.1 LuxR family transcriptional regulator [Streptomyces sp. MZ04]
MCLGEYDISESRVLEALATAERIGDERGCAYAIQYRGALAMVRLQLPQAQRDFDEARRRFRKLGDLDGLVIAAFEQTFGAALDGDREHAWRVSGEGLAVLDSAPGECWTRSYLLLYRQLALWQARNRPADAAAGLIDAADDRAAERERLGEALRLKQAVDDQLGTGIALELLAWSAAESGRCEHAAWLLGAARTIWDRIGCSLCGMEILQAEQWTAAAAARAGLGDTAYEDLHARWASLSGAAVVAYAVEDRDGLPGAEGAAVARESTAPRGRARTAPGGLTHREREVAALVAERLTNREIAERLTVSKRTVDAPVEQILTKLGLTSRRQITGLE